MASPRQGKLKRVLRPLDHPPPPHQYKRWTSFITSTHSVLGVFQILFLFEC